ncbi:MULTISPECIES: DeoR/GlpR family DNA-binding transcription regulator [Microbacterium]|uniref:Lactose phosphotransferase system repressor n=1 Tax=Microbacterium barkeri TaxID=33917 RepID=A0A9W6LXH7_9MICO|nr:DeoR/GlpR family DNA-binding transcription regulator [Microbacterium barkeri]MDR6877092.1 DeoR family fructose operon transcriptional repressor [Microbacterium barkeri]GLJ62874.1 DeoR family transcriptional regulator [Microbacterium barkeri]
MYATERRELIEQALLADARVAVADLAERLGVTTETVRRDLAVLEEAGVLRRVHGGAVPADRGSLAETDLRERVGRHGVAKRRIAQRALDALPSGFTGSVLIDAGTTTAALADLLPARFGGARVEVVTHSVAIAAALSASEGVALSAIGGRVRGVTGAAVGARTVEAISSLRPEIAFVGVNGLSAAFGASTPDPDEADVKGAIVRAARRVVVLADASKFGEESLQRFARLDQLDVLVTDRAPDAALAAALEDAGTEVWVA